MGFRCGCPPMQKKPHKLKGAVTGLARSLSVCLSPHPCLHLSPSLHVSLCLHVCLSLSVSLFLSASMSVSILHLSPSLFLHLSHAPSLSLFLSVSLSLHVSLSPFGLPLEDLAALMRVSAGRTGPVTSHVPERWRPAASTRVTGNRLDRKAARSLGRNDF